MTALAIIIGSSIVAISLCMLVVVISKTADHASDVANLFFAVQITQLRRELDELGYECPEWIKVLDEEELPLDMPPPTKLRLVKIEKDKQEE
ncbi:hypothetical protein LCGC14_0671120 [marine sediment metagenome]|uniref:Uncharacterized protein n=1 Tax=marine sediment metagenome TaxID=412755 RepID=A0A0F9RB52_9ZZZZ